MSSQQGQHSYLFLVRLWSDGTQRDQEAQEAQVEDAREWSGRVQHVVSGEVHSFSDWSTLVSMMLEMARADGAYELEFETPESE